MISAVVRRRCASRRGLHCQSHRRKLSFELEAVIRANAGTKSLRTLATAFGVGHETVRAVMRQDGSAPVQILQIERARSLAERSGAAFGAIAISFGEPGRPRSPARMEQIPELVIPPSRKK